MPGDAVEARERGQVDREGQLCVGVQRGHPEGERVAGKRVDAALGRIVAASGDRERHRLVERAFGDHDVHRRRAEVEHDAWLAADCCESCVVAVSA